MREPTARSNGAKIGQKRLEKGWTQQALADAVGCGFKTIQNAEAGKCVNLSTLSEIAQALAIDVGELVKQGDEAINSLRSDSPSFLLPPPPALLIGRDQAVGDVKLRLCGSSTKRPTRLQVVTAVRGLPGIGKTSLAAAVAHDKDLAKAFPDGILWASLGQKPNLLEELHKWARALGIGDSIKDSVLSETKSRLTSALRQKHILLIIDDAWESTHVAALTVGGPKCATLVTTRETSLAFEIAPTAADVYPLELLSPHDSLKLFQTLAPEVAVEEPEECLSLVEELEGLPLGIQVAARLLNVERHKGFEVRHLLKEIRRGSAILRATAPADRSDLANQTIPTVAALLEKSTDRLTSTIREKFAFLSVFPAKPATFDIKTLKTVWSVKDPKPMVSELVSRGLLEFIPTTKRYYIHALLVLHARSLCSE